MSADEIHTEYNLQAEGGILSSCLLEPARIDEVRTIVGTAESFYSASNRWVYQALVSLVDDGKSVGTAEVAEWLNSRGALRTVGGTPYIAQLAFTQPAADLEEQARVVRDRYRIRRAKALMSEALAKIVAGGVEQDVQKYLELLEGGIASLSQGVDARELRRVVEALDAAYTAIQEASARGDALTGTSTGYARIDKATGGLQGSDLVIVAGRPGSGKTAFAINMAARVAGRGDGVAFFSLEQPNMQLGQRLLSLDGKVDLSKFRSPRFLSPDEWRRLADSLAVLRPLPLWIDDTAAITVSAMRSRIRRLKTQIAAGRAGVQTNGLKVVVVDYIQLCDVPDGNKSREQQVAEVSRGLKMIAKTENLCVLALSQLNRGVESRAGKDRRPQLSDLRESGAIEQDADVVMFVYRDEMYNPESEDRGVAEIIIGKQRQGPTGTRKLRFTGEYGRFDDLADDDYYTEFDDVADN